MPYVTMNRVYVSEKYAQAFEQRFRDRPGLVDQVPGFERNIVLRPDSEETPYIVLTLWESQEAFESWVGSDAFKRVHSGPASLPEEAFPQPGKIEKFESVTDTADKQPHA